MALASLLIAVGVMSSGGAQERNGAPNANYTPLAASASAIPGNPALPGAEKLPKDDTPNTETATTVDETGPEMEPAEPGAPESVTTPEITDGMGFYELMAGMGIGANDTERANILNQIGPQLQEMGVAYYDEGANDWRVALSSGDRLSLEAVKLIMGAANQ